MLLFNKIIAIGYVQKAHLNFILSDCHCTLYQACLDTLFRRKLFLFVKAGQIDYTQFSQHWSFKFVVHHTKSFQPNIVTH